MNIILVSHGDLAKGILSSAQMIIGKQENIEAFGLYPQSSVDDLEKMLETELEKVKETEEILIMTDLFSGSPFNVVTRLMHRYPKVQHITGMNLPLLLEVVTKCNLDMDIRDVSKQAISSAKHAIIDVNTYLQEAD